MIPSVYRSSSRPTKCRHREGLVDAGLVESQVETIRSERIARAVVERLELTEDTEFVGTGPSLIRQVKDAIKSVLGLSSEREPGDSPELLSAPGYIRIQPEGAPCGRELRGQRGVHVRGTPQGRRDRQRDRHRLHRGQARPSAADTMRKASVWLEDRIKELRAQSIAADRAVESFKNENGIVDAGGKVLADQQIADLSSQLAIAKSDAAAARAKVDRIEELNKNGLQEAALPEILRSEVITKLQQQYDDDVRREADWSARYGSNHQVAVALRNEMTQLKKAMQDELQRIGQVYRSEFEIARSREEGLRNQLDKMYQEAAGTGRRRSSCANWIAPPRPTARCSTSTCSAIVGAVQQQSSPITEARIISEALPPRDKSWPKLSVVLLGAVFGGLFLGMGAAFAREKLDTVVRTSVQAEKLLGVECLGILPALNIASVPVPALPRMVRPVADPRFRGGGPDVRIRPDGAVLSIHRDASFREDLDDQQGSGRVPGRRHHLGASRRGENHDRDEPRAADRADRKPRSADRCRLAHDVDDGSPDAECADGPA